MDITRSYDDLGPSFKTRRIFRKSIPLDRVTEEAYLPWKATLMSFMLPYLNKIYGNKLVAYCGKKGDFYYIIMEQKSKRLRVS